MPGTRTSLFSLLILLAVLLVVGSGCTPSTPLPTSVPSTKTADRVTPPAATPRPSSTAAEPTGIPQPIVTSGQTDTPTAGGQSAAATPEPTDPHGWPTSTCQAKSGQIQPGQLISSLQPRPFTFRVYLPPCFQADGSKRYPVLYMLHGQFFTDDQWERIGIGTAATRMILEGAIPPLLIVMPYDPDWQQPDSTTFGQVLVHDLVPWIDEYYPTQPDRRYRGIGGLSRGASWAVHIGLREWQLFSLIGAHSVPLFSADTNKVGLWLDEIPPDQLPRLYIDIGRSDSEINNALDFEALLTNQHIPHEFHLFPGYHDEDYWSSHLEDYLFWYTRDWRN